MTEAGRQDGIHAADFSKGLTEAARRMKQDGLIAGQIAMYTGFSPGEIETL
jgi:hypothetical protein